MKFSVNSAKFLSVLKVAYAAIPSNPVLPILDCVLLNLESGWLEVVSSDLETTVITKLKVEDIKEDGNIALPAKILLDTLGELPDQPVTISVNEKNGVSITSTYGKYKLSGQKASDYPNIPVVVDNAKIEMSDEVLIDGIGSTLFATSNDELRPAMTGVYFLVKNMKMTLVATDAHKLVRYAFNERSTSNMDDNFILSKRSLVLLQKALPRDGEQVAANVNGSNVRFVIPSVNTEVICRRIDAHYPNYEAVIPLDNDMTMEVNRMNLLNCLKRIMIYANKTTNQVILNISEESVVVSTQDLDFAQEAAEELTCTFNGKPIKMGFNAKFLVDVLNVLDGDSIIFYLSTPSRAAIIRQSVSVGDDDLLALVMPVMI